MEYPLETLTDNKEVRILVEEGKYIKYTYIDPKTGKLIKEGKYSLLLKSETSKRHIFVIPLKDEKSMIVKDDIEPRQIKIYDKNNKKEISF